MISLKTVLLYIGGATAFIGSLSLASVLGHIIGEHVSDDIETQEELAGVLVLFVLFAWTFGVGVWL